MAVTGSRTKDPRQGPRASPAKRAFGPEEVERDVEDAKRREAQEREQRKAKWRFSRGAR